MKKIRIAQIGTSGYSHGSDIISALKKADDIFEIVGYTFPENEREKFPDKAKSFDGLREMTLDEILNDPTIDAVTVETEEKYLTKYAYLAALKNKHIHMEKPGGTNLDEFEKLTNIIKDKDIVFHIGYMYRYNPVISRIIKEAQNGKYGEVISVDAQMNCLHPASTRRWLKEFNGGMMFFLGCHLIDLVLRIKGTPDNIIPLNKCTGINGVNSEDFGMAALEYKTGVSVIKTCAVEVGGYVRRNMVITGSEKTVEIRPLEMYAKTGNSDLYTGITEYSGRGWADDGDYSKSESYDRYMPMLRAFGKMVRGEIQNPFSLDYEKELYKTVLKCCGSI